MGAGRGARADGRGGGGRSGEASPRRTLTTLRAESLINDGTALVLFGVATEVGVGAVSAGPFTIVGSFVGSYAGGIAAGLLASGLVVLVRRRLDDPQREGTLSVLTPFLAFLFAELVHASGVVAVVVAGLVLTHASPRVIRARSRVQAFAFWDLTTFMINGGLFVLVGLQFRGVVEGLDGKTLFGALGVAVAITAVVIGTRLVWVQTTPDVIRAIDRRAVQRMRRVGWRQRMVSGWSGFRGAVSLATALAVPATVAGGAPFPDRDLIVFVAAVVILLTILVQGTTLPLVVRWAQLPEDTGRAEELVMARLRAAEAGLAALPRLAADLGVDGEHLDRLRAEYEEYRELAADDTGENGAMRDLDRRLRLCVLWEKRQAVTPCATPTRSTTSCCANSRRRWTSRRSGSSGPSCPTEPPSRLAHGHASYTRAPGGIPVQHPQPDPVLRLDEADHPRADAAPDDAM